MPATATPRQNDPASEIIRMVESPNLKAQIQRALPTHLNVDRLIRIALTVLRTNKDLQACDRLSVIGAIVESSQLGLELDPILGHGYLVPYKDTKREIKICKFIPGYRGFIHLMRNSGLVHLVNAELVVVGDEYSPLLGTERGMYHKPKYQSEVDRLVEKNWVGAYCTVSWVNGMQPDYEYMTSEAINAIRLRSRAKSGPWFTDAGEMWKKTTIRRIAKRMPLSPQTRNMIKAAIRDEYRDSPEFLEKEPVAPALVEPLDTVDVAPIEVSSEPVNETAAVSQKSDTSQTQKKTGKKLKKESEQPPINVKATPVPVYAGKGQLESLQKLATDEKGMTAAEYLQFLGNHGYEKPEEILKDNFPKMWGLLVQEPRRK